MAGYVINLNSAEALELYVTSGVYSTVLNIKPDTKNWQVFEGTFADYASMKPGDNIYFFIKRKLYGIGEIISLEGNGISDCRFNNFPEASKLKYFDYSQVKNKLLWDEGEKSKNQRWICCFKPSPAFYTEGIDMDEVLFSKPEAFRMLRAFWKVSFLKIDDEENLALKEILLRKALEENIPKYPWSNEKHKQIITKLNSNYNLNVQDIIQSCFDTRTGSLNHEAALEAYIIYHLRDKSPHVTDIFGKWDYISRQVIASPFKPIDYMDKMDIFGYSFITGFSSLTPLKHKYLLIELKKGWATKDDVDQAMKYVDWIRSEYTRGDYNPIEAFLVCREFPKEVIEHHEKVAHRTYTIGVKPVKTLTWNKLSLVKYEAFKNTKGDVSIVFKKVK